MNERELRVLRALVDSLRAIQQDIRAIRTQQESNQQQQAIRPIWLDPILTANQQAEANNATKDDRQYRVQNSLRWATWLAFGAAIIYAGISAYQLREIRQQTALAEEQNRPWLKIEDITFLAPDDPKLPILSFMTLPTTPKPMNALSLQMQFHIKNIGKGVAQNIYIVPKIMFDSEHSPADLLGDGERRACGSPKDAPPPIGPPFYRSAVFPGDEFTSNYGTTEPFDVDKIMHPKDHVGDFLAATLVSCVGYQYPSRYLTIAVFHIIGPKDQFIEVDKTLHFGEIRLQRETSYEYAQ